MGFWNKVKDFVGIEDEYYEDEFEDDEIEEYTNNEIDEVSSNRKYEPVQNNYKEERSYKESSYNDVSLNRTKSFGSNKDMTVSIKEPLTYEDGKAVMDDILAGKTVVLNLEMLEMDKKTQIFYFVSGGLYSLKGSIQNVTKDIYVLVPEGVDVDGKLKDTITDKSLYQI